MNQLPPSRPPNSLPVPARGDFAVPAPLALAAPAFAEAKESALRHYWRILFKRRWMVLGITAAGMALGILFAMLTQPQYASVATIQVTRETAKVLNIEGVEGEQSPSYDPEFYQTQYALLKSRSLAEQVTRDLGLADNFRFLSGFGSGDEASLRQLPREQRLAIATGSVQGRVRVNPVRMSSIIDIRYESPDPEAAAAVANSLAENFVESNLTRRFEATAYARQFLQNRLNVVRARLEDSERKAVAYAQREGLIKITPSGSGSSGPEGQQTLVSTELADLSAQLAMARANRVIAESQFRAGIAGGAAAESLTNSAVNALRQQRAELIGQYSKLSSDFGPEYPTVVALQAQIAELDRQVNRETGRIGSSVAQNFGGKYRQALGTENGIQARVNQLKGAVLSEQRRSIQFNIIQRDVDTNRALYDALLQRFKEVGVAGGVGTNNISIVDRAQVPTMPFKPNLRLNILLGLLVGLGLGCAIAFVLEQLEEAAVLPGDFQRKLGIPLLGSTPKIDSSETVHDALGRSKSTLSEAYFSVLTAVQFSTSHGTPTSLLLTSTQAGEGKSVTAYAIGQGLAAVGARVLLIDGDMRNPSLHRMTGKPLRGGLSNLLTGDGTIETLAEETEIANLWVLTAGQIPPNPAELLSTDAIDRVIEEAIKLFDHVVIDGPPILGLADAPLLSRAVEGTVFVMESGRTRATQARHAIERLMAVRGNVIGAVLTKLDTQSAGYGYGYGYDYQYGS